MTVIDSGRKNQDEKWRAEQKWHRVPAGKWFGTKRVWFSDGYHRVVKGEDIWRCSYLAFGGWEDGPYWTYAYAYDEAAWQVALDNRFAMDTLYEISERQLGIDRSPVEITQLYPPNGEICAGCRWPVSCRLFRSSLKRCDMLDWPEVKNAQNTN
jgi:hypothetical protein